MTLADAIKQKLEKLPEDKQQDVLRYIEGLEREGASHGGPRRNPRGTLAGKLPDISLDEFKQLRREMWGDSTDRELDKPL